MKREKILLGMVGVDSGQLVIADPCYIDGEWQHEELGNIHPVHKDTKTGRLWQCVALSEHTVDPDNISPFQTYETRIDRGNGEGINTPNELIKMGQFEVVDDRPWKASKPFSYAKVCEVTSDREKLGGQLYFGIGHPGVGVAFSSGFGDGEYEVWATIINHPTLGRRVESVEIKLITPNEMSLMAELLQRQKAEG